MHDTLDYLHKDPVYRRYAHHQMTFGLMYAWSERFILPLSHDEVVHLKGSLLGKMSGDPWKRFANLRALYGWMWAHPGKKLLFMGGELADEHEWAHESELDWRLLDDPPARRRPPPDGRPRRAVYGVAGALGARREPERLRVDRRRQRGSERAELRPARCPRQPGDRLHRQLRPSRPVRLPCGPALARPLDRGAQHGLRSRTAAAASATWARWRPRLEPMHAFSYSAQLTLPPLAVLWLAPPVAAPHPLLNLGPIGENG